MSAAAIKRLISQRVADALLDYEANWNSRNGNDNRNGSHDSGDGSRRLLHTARECTYKEFLNCQPLNFKGTEIVGHDAAYEMPWKTLIKTMTETYCPRSEIKKLQTELWNLTVKGTNVVSYTQRFQELVLLCLRMVPDEYDKMERYVRGLPDSIQGSVMTSKPKMLQEAIKLANSLMDQKVRAYAARQADNERRMDRIPKDDYV
nr:reverse transcriptase domain-containing protein [Tanacetum cinerariifolium]GEV44767.1 reverse transcriptase domain-containing protein [Tanacetum cinerariifolium]